MTAKKNFTDGAEIRLMLIGRGYVANHLVERIGHQVGGPDRRMQKVAILGATHRADGAPRESGDIPFGHTARARDWLDTATHVLVSVPPDERGDPTLSWLDTPTLSAMPNLRWIGYLSSTGVYGDHGGNWIDETAALKATDGAAGRRKHAEAQWLRAAAGGLPVFVFRLAGIYGPDRSAFDALRRGAARRVDKPGHVLCRCHVDDIVNVILRSLAGFGSSGIFNVADDLPAPQHEVVSFAAELMRVEPPALIPFADADLPAAARRFYEAARRIRNDRIKDELGVTLVYPTYREGLAAIAAAELASQAVSGRSVSQSSASVRVNRSRSSGSDRR